MLKPDGYAIAFDPEGATQEWDTKMCCHCQRIVHLRPRENSIPEGGWCFRCADHVCGPCADAGGCTPWEKRIEAMERRQALFRAVGV